MVNTYFRGQVGELVVGGIERNKVLALGNLRRQSLQLPACERQFLLLPVLANVRAEFVAHNKFANSRHHHHQTSRKDPDRSHTQPTEALAVRSLNRPRSKFALDTVVSRSFSLKSYNLPPQIWYVCSIYRQEHVLITAIFC